MRLSVLTIVKNRPGHLLQLVEGLRRSAVLPDELIIVDMGSAPPITPPDSLFPVILLRLDGTGLPLAAARNAAATAATGSNLLFLDVDCIPMRGLVGEIQRGLEQHDVLLCAEALYLGPDDARGVWNEEELVRTAARHPVRSFPAQGVREEANAGLFWSLVFGIRRDRFRDLGGFDEAFTGYGAEDTDFGFRAKRAGIPLMFLGAAGAFHQHHDVMDPPLQHLEDIVRNAQCFFERWDFWPMDSWLEAFETLGLIGRSETAIKLLRMPSASELEHARRLSAF